MRRTESQEIAFATEQRRHCIRPPAMSDEEAEAAETLRYIPAAPRIGRYEKLTPPPRRYSISK
jgi:hypothetical protein